MSDNDASSSSTDIHSARRYGPVTRAVGFLIVRFTWVMLRVLFRVRVVGLDNVPRKGPVLLISNHPSFLEPILFVAMAHMHLGRNAAFMAWDKLFGIPGVGAVVKSFGAFPVDLNNPGRKPYETLLRVLRAGGMAGVFPEGGRSTTALMGEWKPGALRAALSTDPVIVPVTVIGAQKAWPLDAIFPRFFRRITLHIHPGRRIEDMGEGQVPMGSAKDWLKIVEEQVRREINQPLIDDQQRSIERLAMNYPTNIRANVPTYPVALLPNGQS
ncbi:MAG: 1-acyl-sn-glycerol-3-phosphate acyltransferase [Planctomycetaceae bacterium]|nr:1-acyl-sn-glycerol-3-phosphate acyltransferase [Planctomycetaceae bacterium]